MGRDRRRRRRLRPVLAVLRQQPRSRSAPSTQHIVVPKGLSAPSNGRLLGVDQLADGAHPLELAGIAIPTIMRSPSTSRRSGSPSTSTRAASATASRSSTGTFRARTGRRPALLAEIERTVDFFESDDRPLSIRRREGRRGRDPAPRHGAPDDQRIRQRLQGRAGGLRLAVPSRVQPRMVRQPADQCRLGRHVAARRLRHLHAAALRLEWLRGRMAYDAAMLEERAADRQHAPDRVRPSSDRRARSTTRQSGPGQRHLQQGRAGCSTRCAG